MLTQITTCGCFDNNGNRLLSIHTAAKQFGIPERTLRDWAEKEKIPALRQGKLWKLQKSGLTRYLLLRENGYVQ